MDDSGSKTTRPAGYEAEGYYEVNTDLKKLMPKDFECLAHGWKNKICGAFPSTRLGTGTRAKRPLVVKF